MYRPVLLCILPALLACGSRQQQSPDTAVTSGGLDPHTSLPTTDAPAWATAAHLPGSDAWVVTFSGFGPLRAGMTVAEARAATRNALELPPPSKDPNACHDVELVGGPRGVSFMVEGDRVVRVDVESGRVPTVDGARIGDSEARVQMLYGRRVMVTPHKYTDGHYLTVRPAAVADSAFRIIFETDGHVVTRYRAGIRPPVEYVEGCA